MIEDTDQDLDYDEVDDDSDHDFERRVARRQPGGDVELLLHEMRDLIDQARPAPLSTAVKVDRDTLLDLIDQSLSRLPEDLRQARWQLKEREEFLARSHREADEIVAAARGQAERMVQRSEVMRSAEAKARRIVETARDDAARLRNECDDYCDQRLAQLEAVLEKTMGVIAKGRERLRPTTESHDDDFMDHANDPTTVIGHEEDELDEDDAGLMFDQDRDGERDPVV